MFNLLLRVTTPLLLKAMEGLFDLVLKLIKDYLDNIKEDKIDKKLKQQSKDPNRTRVARDLDRAFNEL